MTIDVLFLQPRYHTNLEGLVDSFGETVRIVIAVGRKNYATPTERANVEHMVIHVSRLEHLFERFYPVANFPMLSIRDTLCLRSRMTRKTTVFIRYCGAVRTLLTASLLKVLGISSVTILSQFLPTEIETSGSLRKLVFLLLSSIGNLTSQVILGDVDRFIAYPFVLPSRYSRADRFSKRDSLSLKQKVIIVAKYQPRKRIVEACEVLSRFAARHDVEITLVLQCLDGSKLRRRPRLVKNSELFSRFRILWNINPRDMVSIYKAHDLLLDFAKNEPASISPLEASALGLAVITSRFNGIYGLLAGRKCCYFHNDSKLSMFLCLRRALR